MALSDTAGNTFAVSGGFLQAATGTTEAYTTLSFKVYTVKVTDPSVSYNTEASSTQLKSIAGDYPFTLTGGAATRIGYAASTYGNGVAQTINGKLKITTGGLLEIYIPNDAESAGDGKVYYSVSGAESAVSAGTAATADEPGSITGSIALAWVE